MNKIFFHELDIYSFLLKRKELKKFLLFLFKKEKVTIERVDIIFCTDEYLLSLNKSFLDHNYYTDTMSFLLSDSKQPVVGELYLSVDRIKANSKLFKITYQQELLRVIIHSCLHLCGYNDKKRNDKIEMMIRENLYLSLI